jgi:transposase
MPRPRSAMRQVREILRLTLGEGLSRRRAATSLGLPPTTVNDMVVRALAAELTWPLPEEWDDRELERRLYRPVGGVSVAKRRPDPDWAEVHKELKRKGVTLQLLWVEYKQREPDGYQYTQFCHRYRQWVRHLNIVMRHVHRAGEKMFVDFAGQTLPITDPVTRISGPRPECSSSGVT